MIIQIALANWPVLVLPKACVRSTRYETDFGARYDAALALGDIFPCPLLFQVIMRKLVINRESISCSVLRVVFMRDSRKEIAYYRISRRQELVIIKYTVKKSVLIF